MKTTLETEIYQHSEDQNYSLIVVFSDNPYRMVFDGNITACQLTESIILDRAYKFFNHESNELKTSDLNMRYIKKTKQERN
jgi:hypothetical protein